MIDIQMPLELNYVLALAWYGFVLIALYLYANWTLESAKRRKWGSVVWQGIILFFLLVSTLPLASQSVTQWYAQLAELRGW